MATLFNTKISDTYEGLIKTSDNGVIGAVEKNLTDGLGNTSTLSIGTSSASFTGTLDLTNATVVGLPSGAVDSVNGQTGVVVLTTTDINEGTNLYFTDARVEANSAVTLNTAKVGITTSQSDAIVLNTAKVSFPEAPIDGQQYARQSQGWSVVSGGGAVDSVNGLTGVVVLDTDNVTEGTTNLYYTDARVDANSNVVANTAKVGITPTQASEIAANTLKVGITTQQSTDITNNNAKISFDSASSTKLNGIETGAEVNTVDSVNGLTGAVSLGLLDLDDVVSDGSNGQVLTTNGSGGFTFTTVAAGGAVDSVNGQTGTVTLDTDDINEGTTNLYYTEARVSANSSVAANTAKVGITTQQASDITTNNAKVGITTAQADEIAVNTLKTGITTQQATDITNNNAKVSMVLGTTAGTALEGNTNLLQLGTTSTTALAGDTTTISPSQATDITNNNAKISFPEAPNDGQQYARQSQSWAVVSGGGGGATELNDLTDVSIGANTSALINVPSGGVGSNSFVMGVGAGNSMTTGSQGMTIIGQDAGATLTSTDYGVYIGAFAGRYQNTSTTQGNVLIGYQAGQGSSTTTTNSYATVAIGHLALHNVTGGDRNVAIGYSALSNNLTGGTTVAIGTECGKGLTSSSNNVFMGYQAAENTNASNSVIIGSQAMDTGAASNMSLATVVGYQAARSATSQRTTAFGAQAAYSQTTAGNTVTIGAYAGYNNTNSGDRTIVGYGSAQYNTGAGNTSFGVNALQGPPSSSGITGGYNTAIGRKSMEEVTTGFFNTAVGNESLADVTTGYFNVAIGNQAGEGYQTGFYNTFVGADAGNTKTAGNNCTMLGYNAQPSTATVANEITLGDGSINSLRCQVTSITSLSDKRDKTKIEESNYGLNVIDKLKPVTFDWNTRDGAKVGVKDLGFIAQDLQEVDDENLKLVYDINPEKLEASYGRLIPVLVKAIQELKAEIEILKS